MLILGIQDHYASGDLHFAPLLTTNYMHVHIAFIRKFAYPDSDQCLLPAKRQVNYQMPEVQNALSAEWGTKHLTLVESCHTSESVYSNHPEYAQGCGERCSTSTIPVGQMLPLQITTIPSLGVPDQ